MSANTASMTNTLDMLERLKTEVPESHPAPCAPDRILKIEPHGDAWRGRIKPKIRLMGRWLERAGFRPGHRVHVTCVAPGIIQLRAPDPSSNQ